LKRLEPEQYLNDSIIDFRLKLLIASLKTNIDEECNSLASPIENKLSKIYIYSSQFYTKLIENSNPDSAYELVRRWTKDIDIFEKEFLFIPINMHFHWSLMVIIRPGLVFDPSSGSSFTENNQPCLLFMDSLSIHKHAKISKVIKRYCKYSKSFFIFLLLILVSIVI
jgi:Ulp1 family protease